MIDSREDIDAIQLDPIYWRHNLKTECQFITRDNINTLISKHGIKGDIGLLSIDIDGNDYWVWEAITVIHPRIVICEYNSLFGDRSPIAIPYASSFVRAEAHHSGGYFGASVAAFDHLASQKGYSLIGANSSGINLFFVRNDCLGALQVLSPADAYVQTSVRDLKIMLGCSISWTFKSVVSRLPIYQLSMSKEMLRCWSKTHYLLQWRTLRNLATPRCPAQPY